jgi:uncharacterized protein YwgA
MKTYDFVHLVLHAAGGRVCGRTKLQKMVYFVGAMTNQLDGLGYRPHYYGPYSSYVSAAVNELRGLGFLTQQILSRGSCDNHGFEVARYDYQLTDEGKLVAEEKTKQFPKDWALIRQAMARFSRADTEDYVKLSIAAKSLFLFMKDNGATSAEERSRLTSRYGWAVTPEEFREADELLRAIDLFPSRS